MKIDRVRIAAPSRLHLGLVGLTLESRRAFGGVGLTVWHHQTIVTARRSKIGTEVTGLDGPRRSQAVRLLQGAGVKNVNVEFAGGPPPHHGFGSGTALRLAILEASALAKGLHLTKEELTVLSGRAGASGIGVHAYFHGGVLADFGRLRSGNSQFVPSGSSRVPRQLPKVMFRIAWPRD